MHLTQGEVVRDRARAAEAAGPGGPRGAWAGWISFGSLLMILIGTLDFFEGLIAIVRGRYYVVTPTQIIVFNFTTWGWLVLIWGLVIVVAGLGLISGASWARWFTIFVGSVNLIGQLAFLGSAQFPLWALTIIALQVVVLYALIVRWREAEAGLVGI